jgi:hypothetical protein
MKRDSVLLIAFCCLVLFGCKSLTDGDNKVCAASASGNARAVFGVASLADNEDIKKQAARIKMGTPDSSDNDAMNEINKVCNDKGFKK